LVVILLDNAVRYTETGSVTITVSEQGNQAALIVTDTGPGIAPEHHAKLFERFYRVDSARSSEEGGTGLGLALAKWIVESHRGHIEVSSAPGRGSSFTVHLPALRRPTGGQSGMERSPVEASRS
jgi:signal transduction histidine kinase